MNHRIGRCCSVLACMALASAAFAGTSGPQPNDPFANLFSASATITGAASEVVIMQIADGQNFVLTQYCRSGAGPGFAPELHGSSFGVIPAGVLEGGCTTYVPGVLLRGGQSLSCSVAFPGGGPEGVSCMITGYKIK
jgi:hypothetical protein